MHVINRIGVAAAGIAAIATSIALAVPASADGAAQSGDVVSVGSDTAQNAVDFVFDGSPGVSGGYNTGGNINRGFNVFATGDANGRALYDATATSLATSVVLRAGTKPVLRPNGSGQGIAALIADAPSGTGYQGLLTGSIQFARASRLPNASEISSCDANSSGCGGLHPYRVATDNLGIARVSSGFNGPAALSIQQLVSIYNCTVTKWNQLPGNSGGSGNTIVPFIPQSGSGTRNFFLADLADANGGSFTLGGCVQTSQEHDPTSIFNAKLNGVSASADAISPFSVGKLAVLNSGYFANGVASSSPSKAAYAANYLKLESGTAGDSNPTYNVGRGIYVVVRQSDVASTTPFQPGGAQTWLQTLVTATSSSFRSLAGKSQLQQAGFTPSYQDCGLDPDPTTSTC